MAAINAAPDRWRESRRRRARRRFFTIDVALRDRVTLKD
jgi:hypothetical protein